VRRRPIGKDLESSFVADNAERPPLLFTGVRALLFTLNVKTKTVSVGLQNYLEFVRTIVTTVTVPTYTYISEDIVSLIIHCLFSYFYVNSFTEQTELYKTILLFI